MKIEATAIPDVFLIHPERRGDHRGFFSETYRADALAEAGVHVDFVQDNMAYSSQKGIVRGLHWQAPPHEQVKLIQVLDGAIFDVAVDLRRGSPWYGRHVCAELTSEDGGQLLVPVGFAHGYCALTPECRVSYKVSGHYAADSEGGLKWDDPDLGIDWPVSSRDAILSDRDHCWDSFKALVTPFSY